MLILQSPRTFQLPLPGRSRLGYLSAKSPCPIVTVSRKTYRSAESNLNASYLDQLPFDGLSSRRSSLSAGGIADWSNLRREVLIPVTIAGITIMRPMKSSSGFEYGFRSPRSTHEHSCKTGSTKNAVGRTIAAWPCPVPGLGNLTLQRCDKYESRRLVDFACTLRSLAPSVHGFIVRPRMAEVISFQGC